ncbi:MAG: low affinity iron permease family protein [Acidobacteria bacterium]|nr:low affinity iron permease family protein [Acidobacteriota bacterium]
MPRKKQNEDQGAGQVSFFTRFSQVVSTYAGKPVSFALACLIVVVWAATGPVFQYSDTWQLVINTGTTIVTFLMVFLIQNTQNRDTRALHLKLDELIVSLKEPSDEFVDLEEMDEDEMQRMHDKLIKRAKAQGHQLTHSDFKEAESEVKGTAKKKSAAKKKPSS